MSTIIYRRAYFTSARFALNILKRRPFASKLSPLPSGGFIVEWADRGVTTHPALCREHVEGVCSRVQ